MLLTHAAQVVIATLVAYGWTVDKRVHLAVPCIILFINVSRRTADRRMTTSDMLLQAMASGATMSVCQVLLVDWLPGRSASVTAANK